MINSPVFPIPSAFKKDGALDLDSIKNYLDYLQTFNVVDYIMTTSGTSQFNLLDRDEIRKLNWLCYSSNFNVIIGLPPLSAKFLYKEIKYINENYSCLSKDRYIAIMLLYPERYYDDENVIRFFSEFSSYSEFPVYIHGLPMKDYRGGIHDYSADLINALATVKNIKGMKEESSSLDVAFNVCKDIKKNDFTIIVAGGSQRRFLLLHPTGVQSFLAGIGSLYPLLDTDFYNSLINFKLEKAYRILNEFETPFFDVFMSIGWHRAFHEGLKQKDLIVSYERPPFYELSENDKNRIKKILTTLERHMDLWYG